MALFDNTTQHAIPTTPLGGGRKEELMALLAQKEAERDTLSQQQPQQPQGGFNLGGALAGLSGGIAGQPFQAPTPLKTSPFEQLATFEMTKLKLEDARRKRATEDKEIEKQGELEQKYVGVDPSQYETRGDFVLTPQFSSGKIVGEKWEPSGASEAKASLRTKEQEAIATQGGKTLSEKYGEGGRLVSMYKNLEGFFKAADEDFKHGGTGSYAEKAMQLANNTIYSPAWLQKYVEPLEAAQAQREETKIAAMPLISGQARYIVSLAQAFDKFIPTIGKEPKNRDILMAQSVRNSMTLLYAIENGYLTAEKLAESGIDPNSKIQINSAEELNNAAQTLLQGVFLSEEQENAVKMAIDDVLGTEPIRDVEASEKRRGVKTSDKERLSTEYGLNR